MQLYHGSETIIERPEYGKGNPYNDYGLGFYCTEHVELAKEWACKDASGGYVNSYELDTAGLKILSLSDYTILHWLALLVHYRKFRMTGALMAEGRDWLEERYLLDVSPYDLITGYRADDSYFRFARAFLQNSLSLEALERAMYLGDLGIQVVLKSETVFHQLQFLSADPVEGPLYYQRRLNRDQTAREQFDVIQREQEHKGIYLIDLLRGEVTLK